MLLFRSHHTFCDTPLLPYLTSPSHLHPDLHSSTAVLTKRGFLWGYWSHLVQHMVSVTQLNIWQYQSSWTPSSHKGIARPNGCLPELKIPILHLNYFLSKRSPTPLINVAPLYTPWLDQTVRWVGKVGCFLSACPSSLKVWVLQTASIRQHHKLRTGLVKKHCPLPYHETQNQLKVTHAKLVLDAVGKVLTIQSKFPIHRVFKTRCNIRKPSKNKQILCKDSLSGYTKICLLKVTGNF